VVKNGGKIIAPVSVQRWVLTSDKDGLLDFPFDIYLLFIKNLDSFPDDLVVGLRLVFSDCRCCLFLMFTQSLLQSSRCLTNVMLSAIIACDVVYHAQHYIGETVELQHQAESWSTKYHTLYM